MLHEMGPDHLEAPARIKIIEEALRGSSLKLNFIEANEAKDVDILMVHSEDLLNLMRRSTGIAKIQITNDTFTNMYTYSAALTSAGGAIQTAEGLDTNHGFSMLRPPGHHATREAAMGFCFFNNMAIAAKVAMKKYDKILILDMDNHFGNGTSNSFENDPNILYISLHADPEASYPGTGHAETVGTHEGLGKTVNLPLPWKLEDADYLVALDEVVIPIAEQFNPDAILVSLGLDGLEGDPYGALGLTTDAYYEMGRRIGALNQRVTNKKVGTILEGGYKYSEIGKATVSYFEGLLDPKGEERVQPKLSTKFTYALRKIKAIQRNHWFDL